jgi:hypothetical protein
MATHKTRAIRDWLACHFRVHQSVVVLAHDVRQWLNNWNQDQNPFLWNKTAEDILQSLSKYTAKISGAGH